MESGKKPKRRGAPLTELRQRIPVGIRMSPELRTRLIERCGATGQSLTAEIEILLERALFLEWIRAGTEAPAFWYAVVGSGDARGAQEAKQRGVSDWSSDPEAGQAARLAVYREMLRSLPAVDLELEKAKLVNVVLAEERRRKVAQTGQDEDELNDDA